MLALFDADILVFRCGFAAERKVWHLSIPSQDYNQEFEYKREAQDELDRRLPGTYSRVEGDDYTLFPEVNLEPLSHAFQNVRTLVKRTMETLQINEFDSVFFLSGGGKTFRHDLATTRAYKGNRKAEHRPTYEQEIRNFIVETYNTVITEDEEADDALGIGQTNAGADESIIITLDKDLDQIPGHKYNFMHDVKYYVTPEEGIETFHLQVMTGDSTDNIPGLPGIGIGKAKKALHGLEDPDEQLREVCRMYAAHSGKEDWKEYLREQARLVYIRKQPGEIWNSPIIDEEEELLGFTEEELTLI